MKNNVQSFVYNFLYISIFCLCMASCEQEIPSIDENKTTKNDLFYTEMYRDSVYLTCEGNLEVPEIIWGNQKVYIPAYQRMKRHLKFNNNRLIWDFTNAAELKISQNIYDYVTSLWTNYNEQLESKNYKLEIKEDYFKIVPTQIETYNTKSYPRLPLYMDAHMSNMIICTAVYHQSHYGYLDEYIDIQHSNLSPDGFGGRSILGRFDQGKKTSSYYCCDPCSLESPRCVASEFVGKESPSYKRPDGDFDHYEKVTNCYGSPLISVVNALAFKPAPFE